MSDCTDLAVVGAGFAGLAAAHLARNSGRETVVLERKSRAGGKGLTLSEHGFVVEQGPLGWLNREPALLDLLEQLEIEPLQAADAQGERFLVKDGRLVPLPTGPLAFMRTPLLSPGGRLRFVSEFLRRRRRSDADESVHDFATRRFGPQAAATLFEAFVSGVFAGDPRQLSVQAAFPLFSRFENNHGSIMRGGFAHMRRLRKQRAQVKAGSLVARMKRGTLLSLPGGMGELAWKLAEPLGQDLRLGRFPDRILYLEQPASDGARWVLKAEGEEMLRAREVLLACPAADAAQMLAPCAPQLGAAAAGMQAASLAVVTIAMRREQASGTIDGFGFLAPRSEGLRPLGVQFCHSIFPAQTPAGWVQLRVMLGGALDPAAMELGDAEMLAAALDPLRPLLGLNGDPMHHWICRWDQVVPQYNMGHLQRVAIFDQAEKRLSGLRFSGDSFHGVGVPAAFARAHALYGPGCS